MGVGPESDEYQAICGYTGPSATVREPCAGRAVRHLQVRSEQYGLVGLATCASHLPVARAAAEVVLEHQHEGWCSMPAAVWLPAPMNVCVVDDSGVEPELLGAAEARHG